MQIETPGGMGPQEDNLDFPSGGHSAAHLAKLLETSGRYATGLTRADTEAPRENCCGERGLYTDIILNLGAIKWLCWQTGN